MENKIEQIYKNYENLKKRNCHINDEDDYNTIRQKDMLFGKIIAYEQVIEILKTE